MQKAALALDQTSRDDVTEDVLKGKFRKGQTSLGVAVRK